MKNSILRTEKLEKNYGSFKALSNLNININKGSIYGLIGENGAGKTTLLKIIAGLSKQSTGRLLIMGSDKDSALRLNRESIGCTIESPALYPNMSVEDNIKIQQLQKKGNIDKKEMLTILEQINLLDKRKKYVWRLSYGMKQRLAIGIALINKPTFLILDEPINGLDPLGIKELRNLLKKLNSNFGTTILISSHLLSELEQIITDYGILHKGVLIEEGSIAELNSKEFKYIKVKSSNGNKLEDVLKLENLDYSRVFDEFKIYESIDMIPSLCRRLVNKNIDIEEIRAVSEGLESYFMRIIKEETNE
ncbi:ABC transporter ATP-binding protein [Thomasclavelia sp.]